MISWKKNQSRYYGQRTQNSLKRQEMCFLARVRVCVLEMCTDLRYFEVYGVRFEIPAFEPVRTVE